MITIIEKAFLVLANIYTSISFITFLYFVFKSGLYDHAKTATRLRMGVAERFWNDQS